MSRRAAKPCRGSFIFGVLCLGAALSPSAAGAADSFPTAFAPNPNVGWISQAGEFIPPPTGPGPVTQDPRYVRVTNEDYRATGRQPTFAMPDLSNPILQPWVKEALQRRNERLLAGGTAFGLGSSCRPTGVPGFLLHVIHPIFFIQGPREVVMVWQGDHVVRRVYLSDKHSDNIKPSYYGNSIGHYEGDTLVVDTIGLNTKAFVDSFQTPHTEKLHVVERFRVIDDGKTLEVNVRIEDEGAFTMPWNAIQRFRRVEPGVAENTIPLNPVSSSADAGPLIEAACPENPISHFGEGTLPVPQAVRPDF